ncbi:MAG: helix-turn-helix transcriptional regulator [Clostridia bacterium]|nr:helix-turn-helix transcriptional regulator [Clostridia bacterium]
MPYLYVLFDRHIGMPPGQYIMKIRIEESKLLLQQGQLSVGAIAERLGFSSIQHFSRQFKSLCGLSPTQYARQFR